jgi:hypothetical protein
MQLPLKLPLTFPFSLINQNSPLYVLTSNIDKEIELQYRIHSALDIIDEKCNAATNKNPDLRDLFLGKSSFKF